MRQAQDLNCVAAMVVDLTEALFPNDQDVELAAALHALADLSAVLIEQASEDDDQAASMCAAFMVRLVGQVEGLMNRADITRH